jgi:hypothetical protein
MYAALKTGDLAAHHAQLDMNSVQVMVNGEVLLRDPGSPDFSQEYLSPQGRYRFYEVQARAHNTLTVGGREHRIDAIGSIVEAQHTPQYRWVAGDAGAALGEDVHFMRHLVMPVAQPGQAGRMLIVLDEVRNVTSEKIAATWHTAGQVQLASGGKSGVIAGQAASLHFAFAGTCPMTVATGPGERPPGDIVITASTPSVTEAMLAWVFSPREPVKVSLRRNSRSEVVLGVGGLLLHWKASRHNLQLQHLEEGNCRPAGEARPGGDCLPGTGTCPRRRR